VFIYYIYYICSDLCQVVILIWGRFDSGHFDHGGTFWLGTLWL